MNIEIEKHSTTCNRHTKLRITSWCKRLCQITDNICWKKNRNLHAIFLLNMIINNKFEDPYDKFPPSESLPILSRALVNSKLTNKFWKATKKIFEYTLKEETPKINDIKEKEKNPFDIINNEDNTNKNEENQLNNNRDEIKNIDNNENINKDSNISEKELKRFYFEKCQLLKIQNEECNKIILLQEEENKTLIKRIEELEKILNNRINLKDI